MGIQRIITQDRSAVTAITATNVRPSDAIEKTQVQRSGNGSIDLTGSYTGDESATFDVRIVSGGANRITRATFTGVGTGSMSDLAVLPGATPQKWTFTLSDLGIDTETAAVEIDGIRIVATTPGDVGNQTFITVDQSGITQAATAYSLLEKLPKGTTEITGAAYDWETAVGKEDEVPADAKRLRIGDSATIYRQWKYYKDGEWRYRFLPEIDMDHPAGSPVWFVTGDRDVTIDSTAGGTIPETYSGIVTLYDLLVAIRDTPSLLVAVDGIISDSRDINNLQAVLDLRLRTDAYLVETGGEGSEYATGFANITIGANAKTEIITAECYANHAPMATLGGEKWTLKGSVSGDLGVITTDDAYTHPSGRFALTIPQKLPNGYDPNQQQGDISYNINLILREENEKKPEVLLTELALGPNAESKTITWTYTRRPDGSCDPVMQTYAKLPDSCLTGAAGGGAITDADYVIRKDRLRAAQINETAWLYEHRRKDMRESLGELLEDIFRGTLSWPSWSANTAYNDFDVIEAGDYKFRAVGDGTSGATPPAWPTTIGATVSDGSLTWECVSLKPLVWWDNLFNLAKGITDGDTTDCSKPYDSTEFHQYILRHRNAILQAAEVPFNAVPVADKQKGGTCWLASSDPFWWVPDDPTYLPAFTNREYHSVKGTEKDPIPTHEFGFAILVNEKCIGLLKEGDQIILNVGQSAWPSTYQVGDKLYMTMVAAGDHHLSGGIDGTDELTWKVSGGVSGQAADYVMPKAAPPLYDNGQIQARINDGGVPFTLDDQFAFCVETGQFEWRKNGGAWSAAQDIADVPLSDGVTVQFIEGVCPSFVDGDIANFTAHQPNAPGNAMQPDDARYAWDGAATTITLGCSGTVDALAIAMHSLGNGASITVSDGITNWPLPVREGVSALLFDPELVDPTLTLTITGASDDTIGWLWAGQSLQFNADADNETRTLDWRMSSAVGSNDNAVLRGYGAGWTSTWTGFVTLAELDALKSGIIWHKQSGNLPAVYVPSMDSQSLASLVLMPDSIDVSDFMSFACESEALLEFSMTLKAWVQNNG